MCFQGLQSNQLADELRGIDEALGIGQLLTWTDDTELEAQDLIAIRESDATRFSRSAALPNLCTCLNAAAQARAQRCASKSVREGWCVQGSATVS